MDLLKALREGQDGQATIDFDGIGLFALTAVIVSLTFLEVSFGAWYGDFREAGEAYAGFFVRLLGAIM